MRGPAAPSKTVHGIPVSTRGIIVPSTPKGQTGKFPIQGQKAQRRTELIPPPPPTIPQQLQHPTSRPNDEAYPPLGIPFGIGTPTSSLGADHSLPSNQRIRNQLARPGRGNANDRGGRGAGDQGKPSPKIPPHIVSMSKNVGKAAAILLSRSLTFPINFQSFVYSGLPVHEQDYIKVSVFAYQIYHHSQGGISAHFLGHLWHNLSTGDFIQLMNNVDLAVSNFKKPPHYPFPSP